MYLKRENKDNENNDESNKNSDGVMDSSSNAIRECQMGVQTPLAILGNTLGLNLRVAPSSQKGRLWPALHA